MDPPLPRQESSGALPEIADVQPADMERYIKPIIKEMYAEIKSAVKDHMALIKSQLVPRLKGYASSYTPPEWEPLPLPAWMPLPQLPKPIEQSQ